MDINSLDYENNLVVTEKLNENINTINQFTKWLEDNRFQTTFEQYDMLIKQNEKLSEIIQKIVSETNSKNLSFEGIGLTNTSIELIEVYCVDNLQEQEIEDNEEYDINNINIGDNFSLLNIYYQEIHKYKLLTSEEEKELTTKYYDTKDKKIKEKLINSNLRFVIKVANKYRNKGIDIIDLYQEGCLGLMTAVEKFDPTKGHRLSTYADWWIKQTIRKAISEQSRNIRIPINFYTELNKYKIDKDNLEFNAGKNLTPEEISEKLNLNIKKVMDYEKFLHDTISLNTKIGKEEDMSLEEVIADTKPTPEEMLETDINKKYLKEILDQLEPKQRAILILRYGLDGGETRTFKEIGELLPKLNITKEKITKQRVEQLEKKALKRVRNIANSYKYRLNDNIKTEPKQNQNKVSIDDFYAFYYKHGYTLEDINYFLSRFNKEQKDKLYRFYGQDLKRTNTNILPTAKKEIYNIIKLPIKNNWIEDKNKDYNIQDSTLDYEKLINEYLLTNSLNDIITKYNLSHEEELIFKLKLSLYYYNKNQFEQYLTLIKEVEEEKNTTQKVLSLKQKILTIKNY